MIKMMFDSGRRRQCRETYVVVCKIIVKLTLCKNNSRCEFGWTVDVQHTLGMGYFVIFFVYIE
jgi:hypothetical protein